LIVGSLNDPTRLREAVGGAHVVFHLAAMKSVALCEMNPTEAIQTNVLGTDSLIQAALVESKLEHFVAISSDKASRPTSVYGLTKALLERMVAQAAGRSNADFGTVRCGSLWGSPGSVLDRWREAEKTGSDLLVTDPEMTRFVMHRSEAVDLILEAATRNMAGAILCRVMPAYVLAELASVMTEILGLKQRVTGARPGENLHEDLVSETEAPFTERRGDFFTIMPGGHISGAEPFSSMNAPRLNRTEVKGLVTSLLATNA
jgi:FlaA1/EpsC-like NDP-sugar epimerase